MVLLPFVFLNSLVLAYLSIGLDTQWYYGTTEPTIFDVPTWTVLLVIDICFLVGLFLKEKKKPLPRLKGFILALCLNANWLLIFSASVIPSLNKTSFSYVYWIRCIISLKPVSIKGKAEFIVYWLIRFALLIYLLVKTYRLLFKRRTERQ